MSSVFFKFKSQKEPQRVTFDGTGISVFELKREIISISRLGDGTDFDLNIYNQDTNEEYDDDTVIIPRSTSVVARRLPAARPGQGRGARYVSGRMPVMAKNNYRKEQTTTATSAIGSNGASISRTASAMQNASTEEERIKAMFEMGGAQWEQQQQHMSNASRVAFSGAKNKNVNVPDHPPPMGYVCYRCGQKGHWIQVCPTNDNPDFENKPRIKRITGIPRSFLKTVEEPIAAQQDGLTDDARQPGSIMVNAEGDRVVAVPDMASWQKYQEKALASTANQDAAAQGSKELRELGLECPIDKRMFVDPMKTPCCGTTYCNECIENALIDSDLVCPNCSTEGVLLDNLAPDEAVIKKMQSFEEAEKAEKKVEKKIVDKADSPAPSTEKAGKDASADAPGSPTSSLKRKRSSEDIAKSVRIPDGPRAMKRAGSAAPDGKESRAQAAKPLPATISNVDFVQQMNAMAGMQGQATPFSGMNINPMMSMPNPMMMNQMMGQMMGPNGWHPNMNMNMAMMMGANGMPPFNSTAGSIGNAGNSMGATGTGLGNGGQSWAQPQQSMNSAGRGGFQQSQPGARSYQQSAVDQNNDDAYIRKPVNPHRHQGRQKKVRPTDYREL